MNLSKGLTNEEYIIENILTDDATRTRLEVLGVIIGTKVVILNKRISGLIIKVRGTRLGIGREISNSIKIRKEEKNANFKSCIYR